MKRVNILNIILFVFSISSSIAQNQYDVLKYNPKPTVADQHSYVVHYDYQNRILDYPIVREDDTSALFHGSLLGAPLIRIAGGTDEVLKNIIAEQVLGMPQDIRVDKNVPFNEIPTGTKN